MPPHGDHLRVFDRPVPKQLSVSWRTTFELGGISAALFYLLGCWSFWPWLLFIFTLLDGLCRKGRKIGLFDVIHLIIYGVATAKYIWVARHVLRILPSWFARKFGEHYHGKVLTFEHAKAFVSCNKNIPLHDLGERIIPYPMARDLILQGPPAIGVIDCCCRMSKPKHCEPVQVCMVVGDHLIKGIEGTGSKKVRRLTTDEALAMLDAEHKRGHVHSAWFKDIFLGQCFAICNCCKCCCAGIEMMLQCDARNMISSGFVASPMQDKGCISCGACVRACPFNAISITPGVGAVVDEAKCMGCGVCVEKCPKKCLELKRDPKKGDPLDLNELF